MKMIFGVLTLLMICLLTGSYAQRVVFDRKHFQAVMENNAVQSTAEVSHNQFLNRINTNLQDINVDVGTVVLAESILYDGLSNVNSALKNGIAVRNLSGLVADMLNYTGQMAVLAKTEPYLTLFAEEAGREMKARATALLSDVSNCILKQGDNMLADYNSRDQLLKRVTQQLQILDALAYGAWRAMFWAKEQGVIRSVNPFRNWISADKAFAADIIRNTKYLKR